MSPRRAAAIRAGIHWARYDLNGPVSQTEPQYGATRAAYLRTIARAGIRARQDIDDIREYRRQTWKRA